MLVDTAAQHGCVGSPQLHKLQATLAEHGLKIKWVDRTPSVTGGIGGKASVLGRVQIPVAFGGLCGLLECSVLEQDVPGLIPMTFKCPGCRY